MPSVYVETTIPSYYFETRRSMQVQAWREATRLWWDQYRFDYTLVTSRVVHVELGQSPPSKRKSMLELLDDVDVLDHDARVIEAIEYYIKHRVMPTDAGGDAAHLAYASVHGADYLLTWNCKHLANANKFKHIEVANRRLGLSVPMLITPFQLVPE